MHLNCIFDINGTQANEARLKDKDREEKGNATAFHKICFAVLQISAKHSWCVCACMGVCVCIYVCVCVKSGI